MVYQEEEQARLIRQRSKEAIALAMQGRWQEAVAANKSLVESFPNDVDAYNRLGRAYMELGEYSRSKEAYHRAIELDPYSVIAQKNLQRLSRLEGAEVGSEGKSQKVEPQHFIEETGKAGIVNLYRLAPPEVLVRMVAGDKVYLEIDGSNLIAKNGCGEYLGQVEPKHGQRLVRLMWGGNEYIAAIIRSTDDMMVIIIKEEYQDPGQAGRLSFPSRGLGGVRPQVSDRIFRREREEAEGVMEEVGYTIISEDGVELLPRAPSDDYKQDNEE